MNCYRKIIQNGKQRSASDQLHKQILMQNRREFLKTIAVGAAGIAIFPQLSFGQPADAWTTLYPQILSRIKAPKFPKRDFAITKFGAKAGIANDSTAAI